MQGRRPGALALDRRRHAVPRRGRRLSARRRLPGDVRAQRTRTCCWSRSGPRRAERRRTRWFTGASRAIWQTDRDNALLFDVASRDGKERFTARLPFALRPVEGGEKKIFGHPAIVHHGGSDLYFALKDGTGSSSTGPVFQPKMKLGDVKQIGPYTLEFLHFDNPMGALVRATGQMPDVFPVAAVVRVTYQGVQPGQAAVHPLQGQPEPEVAGDRAARRLP